MTNATSPKIPVRADVSGTFSYEHWLENFLRVILRFALIVGLVMGLSSVLSVNSAVIFFVYGSMYLIVLLANFAPFPYRVRAGLFVTIFFILGISGLLEYGIRGDSRLFFVVFAVAGALFFGEKSTYYSIGATLIAGVVFGALILTGTITIVNPDVPLGDVGAWVVAFVEISLLSAMINYGLAILFREFVKAQEKAQDTVSLLTEEHTLLETRVSERTRELSLASIKSQKQAEQLKAIAEVSHQIAAVRDINELLPALAQLISEKLGFYHAGIFLLDEAKEYVVLQAANSEGGQKMLARGHRLKVGGTGLVSFAVTMNRSRIALDVGDDAFFFNNPDLPKTRSEIALPLQSGSQVIGALDVQSVEPGAFGPEDVEVMETLADQVTLAIENARLLTESRQRLDELQAISQEFLFAHWSGDTTGAELKGFRYNQDGVQSLQEQVRRSEVQEALTTGLVARNEKGVASIAVPVKIRNQSIGVLNIQSSEKEKKFSEEEVAFLQAIAERIALSMENARLFGEAQKRAAKERTIGKISAQIGESSNVDKILQVAAEEIGRALPGSEVIVQVQSSQD